MYKKLYFGLFNRLTDVLELLEQQKYDEARELIIKIQQEAEERYLDGE